MSSPTADPVFQLNTVLWMLQPTPAGARRVNAVFWRIGYALRALGPKLTAPAAIEAELGEKLQLSAGVPEPDLLASAPSAHPWPVFECKASSFGPDSPTASQAKKLLARAKDLALVVGAPPGKVVPGAVVYVTREAEGAALVATLDELRGAMMAEGVATAPASVIGIANRVGEGVSAVLSGGDLPGPAGAALSQPAIIVAPSDEGDVARPLYFIPFDPGVEQEADERQYCLRVLLERTRSHVAGLVGRALCPSTVVVDGLEVLRAATYGVSDYWRATSDRDRAARMAMKFCRNAMSSIKPDPPLVFVAPNNGLRIEVHIASDQQRSTTAEALIAAALPGEIVLPDVEQQELVFGDTTLETESAPEA